MAMNRKLMLAGFSIFLLSAAAVNAQDYSKFEVFGGFSVMRGDFKYNRPSTGDINITPAPLTTDYAAAFSSIHDQMFDQATLPGFDVSFTVNINELFGIEADLSRHTNEELIHLSGQFDHMSQAYEDMASWANEQVYLYCVMEDCEPVPFEVFPSEQLFAHSLFGTADVNTSTLNLLFGPKFTFRNSSRFTPFIHGLLGISHIETETSGQYELSASIEGDLNRPVLDIRPYAYIVDQYDGSSSYTVSIGESSSSNTGFAVALGGGIDVKINKTLGIRLFQLDWIESNNELDYSASVMETSAGSSLSLTEEVFDPPSPERGPSDVEWWDPVLSTEMEFTSVNQQGDTYSIQYKTSGSWLNNLRFSFGVTIGF
jgi:hypothetical protein